MGKMCEKCAPGFAKYGRFECRKCHEKGLAKVVFAGIFLLMCVVMAVYIFVMMNSVGLSETTSSGFKILVNTFQLASLGAGFPLQWPGSIMNLFATFGSASSASDQVLQFDCILVDNNLPKIYQKTIIIAFVPVFSVVLCFALMTIVSVYKKHKSFLVQHQEISSELHREYHNEWEKRKKERNALIGEIATREKRLAFQYKYFLRENTKIKYTPPLNKKAIALLRRTMKKASRKGIHIVASVKKFENPSTKLIDIRNVVQMFKDWDVGLTVPELETIRDLLDHDADCKLDSFEILQYNHQLFDKFVLAFSLIWYMQYPVLTTTAFKILGCRTDLEDGEHFAYLRSDYDVPCYDDSHRVMTLLVAMPMLICYTIGLPIGTLLALLRYKGRSRNSDLVRFKFGLFTDGYRKDRIWWETIVALRKACVIMVSVFLSTYGALQQAYVGILIVGVFLAVQLYERPYDKPVLNDLEAFGMMACFATLYAGLLFYMNVLTNTVVLVIAEILVITINVAFVVFASSELLIEYALGVSTNPRFLRFVIRYHKVIGCFCKFSRRTMEKIEAIHSKLERRFHMEADELMHVQKFKKKVRLSITNKGKGLNNAKVTSSTKVSPSLAQETRGRDDVSRLQETRKKFGAGSKEYKTELEEWSERESKKQ